MAIQDKFNKPNVIYKITKDIDLGGGTLTIPEGCTLDFQGGSFSNGLINLNKTKINTISDITIFKQILLFGYINNNHLSVKWFGVMADNEEYSLQNWDIITKYVIPSAENTNKKIYIPSGNYYFNDTIQIKKSELDCEGTLVYNGNIQNKALIIGDAASVITNNTYTIKLSQKFDIRPYYTEADSIYTIPENYGVEFVNLLYCKINIESVEGFAKEVTLVGDGNGFSSTRVDIKRIGRYPYYCLKLENRNNGYINENLFIGGELRTFESPLNKKQNYGILLEETTGIDRLVVNNNIFIKQCCEHFYNAVKIVYGRDNLFFGMRAEDCSFPMIVENGYSLNNVFLGNELSETYNMSTGVVAKYDAMFPLKAIRTDKVCSFKYYKDPFNFYGTNLLYFRGDSSYYQVSTGFMGYKLKVKKNQTVRLDSTRPSSKTIICFDENNSKIQLSWSNYNEYVRAMQGAFVYDGELSSTTDTNISIQATFTDKVHSVFIGVNSVGGYITLLSSLQTELINEDKMNISELIPQESSGFGVGDRLWIESINKNVYWTGSKWVDATGTEV